MTAVDRVGLVGATGAIGHSVAVALRARGIPYRVIGRSRPVLETAFGEDRRAEIVTWDPSQPESVRTAARGLGALVHMVGVPYWQFEQHPIVMRQTLAGAIAEGVDRLLLIGTVYPYGRPRTERVTEAHPREPHTFKGRMRKEQEDLALAAHAARSIKTTILRLPDFYGPGVERSFLTDAFTAAVDNRRAKLVGPVDRPHEFVYVPDIGPVVVSLLTQAGAFGRAWNLAGAGVTTQRTLVERIFAEMDRKPRFLAAGKTLLRVLGLFDPFMRELVEMHYLFTSPVLLDDSALRVLLGNVRKTPYEEGIKRTLEATRNRRRATASPA